MALGAQWALVLSAQPPVAPAVVVGLAALVAQLVEQRDPPAFALVSLATVELGGLAGVVRELLGKLPVGFLLVAALPYP